MSIIKPRRGSGSPTGLTANELAIDTTNKRVYLCNAAGTGDIVASHIENYVSSFNGSSGAVTFVNYVSSVNGATGAITNVAFTNVDNNFSVGQTFASDIAVNGGNLTSNQTTFNLLNSTVTTLNIAGASGSTINIGATAGTSTIDMNSNLLKEVEFRNYFETKATASTTAVGMATYLLCDLSSSNVFTFSTTITAISGISVTNIPSKANTSVGFTIVITNGNALSSFNYDVFASGSVKWAGGTPPTFTTTTGNTDIISYVTYDG